MIFVTVLLEVEPKILKTEFTISEQISLYVENEIVSLCRIETYEQVNQVQLVVVQIHEHVEITSNGEIIMDSLQILIEMQVFHDERVQEIHKNQIV